MNRVHGEIKITRKKDVRSGSPYSQYRESLREDFHRICGYCGKSEFVTKNAFEIDHFVPQRIAPERENDYSNLVYACYECNRKKSGKWPSEDEHIQFLDGRGFVDPASDDYDEHLERDASGRIIGKTAAGKYMVEEGFKFGQRPMQEIYKASLLIEKMQQFEEKMKELSEEEARSYIEISVTLRALQNLLFENKE